MCNINAEKPETKGIDRSLSLTEVPPIQCLFAAVQRNVHLHIKSPLTWCYCPREKLFGKIIIPHRGVKLGPQQALCWGAWVFWWDGKWRNCPWGYDKTASRCSAPNSPVPLIPRRRLSRWDFVRRAKRSPAGHTAAAPLTPRPAPGPDGGPDRLNRHRPTVGTRPSPPAGRGGGRRSGPRRVHSGTLRRRGCSPAVWGARAGSSQLVGGAEGPPRAVTRVASAVICCVCLLCPRTAELKAVSVHLRLWESLSATQGTLCRQNCGGGKDRGSAGATGGVCREATGPLACCGCLWNRMGGCRSPHTWTPLGRW